MAELKQIQVDGVIYDINVEDGKINTAQLADSAVTTAKIADSNVTTDKVAAKAVTKAKLADAVNEEIEDKAPKASANPAMLVGSALGIMGNTPQAALYTHRAVPAGAGSGAAQMRLLRGRSIVWNQLVGADTESVTIPSGHKYYAVIDGVASVATSDGSAIAVTGGQDMVIDLTAMTLPDLTASAFEALYPGFHGFNSGTIKNLMATGLLSDGFNQWNEVWEKGYFYVDAAGIHYAISNSTIRSKNYIPVFADADYYIIIPTGASYINVAYFDADKNYIGNTGNITTTSFHTPTKCSFVRFFVEGVSTYANNICINRSNPARNGQYEPHRSYTLGINIPTLKGKAGGVGESVVIYPNGMMSAGTAYDYGRVDADGWMRMVVKVMGMVDLGDIAGWSMHTTIEGLFVNNSGLPYKLTPPCNAVSNKYPVFYEEGGTQANAHNNAITLLVRSSNPVSVIYLKDSSISPSDIVDGKIAKLDGIHLIYQLDTPVEYTLDTPIYMGYPVDADGTETMQPDQTGLSEPTSAPIDYDVVYPIDAAGNLVTALNAMLTENSLAGAFSKDGNGGISYSND